MQVISTMRRVPVDSSPTGLLISDVRPMISMSSRALASFFLSAPVRPSTDFQRLVGATRSCATMTVSRTDIVGNRRAAWNERTTPRRARSSGASLVRSLPSNTVVPASGGVKPATISNSVVLPAPFGPMMPRISPSRTSRSTFWTALTPPKFFDMPRT